MRRDAIVDVGMKCDDRPGIGRVKRRSAEGKEKVMPMEDDEPGESDQWAAGPDVLDVPDLGFPRHHQRGAVE
jgi:hypothetical protein